MCQICTIAYGRSQTIATRYSRRQLDRPPPSSQVFNLSQFSSVVDRARSVDTFQTQTLNLTQKPTSTKTPITLRRLG